MHHGWAGASSRPQASLEEMRAEARLVTTKGWHVNLSYQDDELGEEFISDPRVCELENVEDPDRKPPPCRRGCVCYSSCTCSRGIVGRATWMTI